MPVRHTEFPMPPLGAGLEAGVVRDWLVAPGDRVRRGDVAVVVEAGGTALDVRSAITGEVTEILVRPGTEAAVGAPLALVAPITGVLAHPPVRLLAARLGVDIATLHGTGSDGRIIREDVLRAASSARPGARVSRYARRVAADLGVDLSTVAGRGPGNTIRVADIRAAAIPVPALPRGRVTRHRPSAPHYSLSATIDLRAARDLLRERPDVPLTALLLKAAAFAAERVPELNGHWVDGGFRRGERVDLGVTTSLRGGEFATVTIADAAALSLPDFAALLTGAVARARAGRSWASELAVPTITVTDLAAAGVESLNGAVHPPQVAHAGFGAVTWRPGVHGDELGLRPHVTATLSADHRTGPPTVGARYLRALATYLHSP